MCSFIHLLSLFCFLTNVMILLDAQCLFALRKIKLLLSFMYDFLVSHVYYNPKVWVGIMCWETSICLNLMCQVQCSWFSIGVLACENLPYISQPIYKSYKFSLDKLRFNVCSMTSKWWKICENWTKFMNKRTNIVAIYNFKY